MRHVAFTPSVQAVQSERGSRAGYAKVEARGALATQVDDTLRAFLADIDTAYLATVSADGQPYLQHRGGPKGFIRAIDDRTLAFVDLSGNRQYVSTGNLRDDPRVCLFLMDYAHRRRVKVWGTARMVPVDPELLARLVVPPGAKLEQIALVTVAQWEANCPQHIPVKIDGADVAAAIERFQARIAKLEAENAELRAAVRAR